MRTKVQKVIDTITFPFRAFSLFYEDRWGLSSQSTERYDYVRKEVQGYCLDIGCGIDNLFITRWMDGDGIGIDVPQIGIDLYLVVKDLSRLPYKNGTFLTVTFNACLNHAPRSKRYWEIKEAYRCLKIGGNIIITMPNPLAGIVVHKIVKLYDRFLGTSLDIDNKRGMDEEEDYFITDREIKSYLEGAGFKELKKKYFWTQWGFNHLWTGTKS